MQLASPKQTRSRWPAAAVLGLFAAASVAQVGGFDDKLKAPRVTSAADLRGEAQAFAVKVQQIRSASPRQLVTDSALATQRFDLEWKIQQSIDARDPLGDLSSIGLESTGDGAYRIDFAKSPQWHRIDDVLVAVLPRTDWTNLAPQLLARGFRPADLDTLREYVTTHDVDRDVRQSGLKVSIGFSRLVKKLDKLKRPVSDDLVLSYLYQRNRLASEVRRQWAAGLLQSLDDQRQRVLVSFFTEAPGAAIWAPSDARAGIADVLATLRRPDFEKAATDESNGVVP